jgi:hypothetical protein
MSGRLERPKTKSKPGNRRETNTQTSDEDKKEKAGAFG